MARSKIGGSLKINAGAVAPSNQGAALKQVLRTVSHIKQFLSTRSQIKQELRAK